MKTALVVLTVGLPGLQPRALMAQDALPMSPEVDAVEQLFLAHELFRRGTADGDALAVLAAARLAAPVAAQAVSRIPGRDATKTTSARETEDSAGPEEMAGELAPRELAPGELATGELSTGDQVPAIPPPPDSAAEAAAQAASGPAAPPDAAEMFERALSLAGEDEFLAAYITRIRDEPVQASPRAAYALRSDLAPGEADLWEIAVQTGMDTGIAVIGGGAANLDIQMRDSAGNTLCSESGPEDLLYCRFTAAGGIAHVLVENRGDALSRYDLITR